jgi:hypothetical protein
MTAVTISTTRGADYDKSASYTVATTAPTTNFELEIRYQLLDANGNQLTKLDVINFLQAVAFGLESGKGFFGNAVTGTNFTGPQI